MGLHRAINKREKEGNGVIQKQLSEVESRGGSSQNMLPTLGNPSFLVGFPFVLMDFVQFSFLILPALDILFQ